jgi:enoyl-CoA hydratase
MQFHHLLVAREGHIAQITINRPDKLNALNSEVIQELSACFQSLNLDQQIRCIVLTGAGEKAFVAGADISEFAHFDVNRGKELSQEGHVKLFNLIEHLTTPVIAAINGFALGGGLELAMSCHIRVASSNAKMGLPEVSLGVIPGYGGTQRLPKLIGKGRALELITTAQMIDAETAYRYGLVNYVVELPELIEKANAIAAKIIKNSPTAIGLAIKAVNAAENAVRDGYSAEVELFGEAFGTGDFTEGTTAFLEKRKPNFKGN